MKIRMRHGDFIYYHIIYYYLLLYLLYSFLLFKGTTNEKEFFTPIRIILIFNQSSKKFSWAELKKEEEGKYSFHFLFLGIAKRKRRPISILRRALFHRC